MSWLSNTLGTSRPNAPTLPQAPTLQAPQLPQYPGFTPQQTALLGQQQQTLTGAQNALSAYGSNPYLQQSQQASQQALTNYQNSLTGNIPQNQMIAQQQQEAWNQAVQQAAQQGIRITGSTPGGAISQSTAGNQIISDFNKTWGALNQNYNLGQQQIGLQAQQAGNQQANTQFQNQLGGANTVSQLNQNLQAPYLQQSLGQYGQQTQQVLSNTDIANQNAMNAYQQQLQQIGLNYNSQLAGYQNSMGLLSGGLQLGGMALGGALGSAAGPMGTLLGSQIGGQIGGQVGQATTGQGGGSSSNFPSLISAYQQLTPPNTQMGMQQPSPSYGGGYQGGTGSYGPNPYLYAQYGGQ
jgi:hypothetical protein